MDLEEIEKGADPRSFQACFWEKLRLFDGKYLSCPQGRLSHPGVPSFDKVRVALNGSPGTKGAIH